ncbi:MAG: hypothetical protein GF344_09675 [Chitinivibrionales bacterium]|nr:hypothetical protein [Chitinivibrionales bacterium]MBD3357111.1 hypothetical protein [Chitinivibrionales bacterium]
MKTKFLALAALCRYLLLGCIALICGAGCAGSIKEFYPDSYFEADRVYLNRPLRFSLTFRGNWRLFTDPNEMEEGARTFFRELQKNGAELLFVGATPEGTQAVRAIAINLNLPQRDYAERIRALNRKSIAKDLGLTEMHINGRVMTRWDYVSHGARFAEFFFALDTYNIRIAFWSTPTVFERFYPVYLDIISTLDFVSRY